MSINWGKLVDQGRAKAIGVSWSEEELRALFHLKIPAEFVRNGIITLEAYKQDKGKVEEVEKETKKKPIRYMSKPELIKEAESLGLPVVPEVTRADLIMFIEEEIKKKSNII